MNFLRHALQGWKAVVSLRRMVLLLAALNLAAALLLTVPFFGLLRDSLGSSGAGERMSSGFDYVWWQEFRDTHAGLADSFSPDRLGRGALLSNWDAWLTFGFLRWPPSVLALLGCFVLVHVFLAGGVVFSLTRSPTVFSSSQFFRGAGGFFFRFLGFALLAGAMFFGLGLPLNKLMERTVFQASSGAASEVGPFFLNLGLRLGFLLFFLLIQTVFDYARLITVEDETRNVFAALGRGIRFLVRHPASVSGLVGLFLILSLLVSVLYIWLREAVPFAPGWTFLASFLWQQIFILSLVALRCGSYAALLSLYRFHGRSLPELKP